MVHRGPFARRALVMMLPFVLGLLAVGSLSIDADAWGQVTQSGSGTGQPQASGQSLAMLVERYLTVEDHGRAESLLQAILVYPRASLQRVSGLLRAGRTYETAPVGMLPSQPVQVRGQTLSYGLFVPFAYDPEVAFPLLKPLVAFA